MKRICHRIRRICYRMKRKDEKEENELLLRRQLVGTC
jgi:hypothetical protein